MSGPISSSIPEPDRDGLLVGVTPDPAGWESVGFDAPRLGKGRTIERRTDDTEAFPAVLS